MTTPPTEPIDTTGFYFTADDGYLALSFYSDPEDEETGQLVCFVEAGDTLEKILTEVRAFTPEQA